MTAVWRFSVDRQHLKEIALMGSRRDHEVQLAKESARLSEVPTRAMEKLGWIPKEKSKVRKLERVLSFFGVASIQALQNRADARFRWQKPHSFWTRRS